MSMKQCPRCLWECFEKLKTHSHCVNCNYYEVRSVKLPQHSPLPPMPKAPEAATKTIELTVFESDELVTPLVHDSKPYKKTG